MNSKKVYYIMLGVLGLLSIASIGVTSFGSSVLEGSASRLVALKLESKLTEEQQIALKQAVKDVQAYEELDKIARAIVPQDKDQARAVREIITYARDSGITIKAINLPASNLGQALPKPAAPAEGTTAPAAPAAPPLTQVRPVDGLKGVYVMEITVQSEQFGASFNRLIDFLSKLENNRRTAHVTGINITPNRDNRNQLSVQTIINVYIRP